MDVTQRIKAENITKLSLSIEEVYFQSFFQRISPTKLTFLIKVAKYFFDRKKVQYNEHTKNIEIKNSSFVKSLSTGLLIEY